MTRRQASGTDFVWSGTKLAAGIPWTAIVQCRYFSGSRCSKRCNRGEMLRSLEVWWMLQFPADTQQRTPLFIRFYWTLQPVSEIQFDRICLKLSRVFSAHSFLLDFISSRFQDLQFFVRSSWQNPPFRRFYAAGQQMLHSEGLQSWGYRQLWLHLWI